MGGWDSARQGTSGQWPRRREFHGYGPEMDADLMDFIVPADWYPQLAQWFIMVLQTWSGWFFWRSHKDLSLFQWMIVIQLERIRSLRKWTMFLNFAWEFYMIYVLRIVTCFIVSLPKLGLLLFFFGGWQSVDTCFHHRETPQMPC